LHDSHWRDAQPEQTASNSAIGMGFIQASMQNQGRKWTAGETSAYP
jgi:hypothetical protein